MSRTINSMIAIFLGLHCHAAFSKTVRLAYDDFCPYSCTSAQNEGFVVDALKEILRKEGIEVVTTKASWSRILAMISKKELDLVAPVTRFEAENLGITRNRQALARLHGQFFVRKDSPWNYSGENSLRGQYLALIKDYWYAPDIMAHATKAGKRNAFFLTAENGTERQVKMLIKGRVTAVVSDRNAFWYHAHKVGLDQYIREAGGRQFETRFADLHVGIASSNPDFRNELETIINKGFLELRRSNGLETMRKLYMLR